MKTKSWLVVLSLGILASCNGCGGGGGSSAPSAPQLSIEANAKIDYEAVLPLGEGPFTLSQPAARITEVRQWATGAIYSEGTDYKLQDGKLVLLKTGAVPILPVDWINQPDPNSDAPEGLGGKKFSPTQYHQAVITVSYYAPAAPSYPSAHLRFPANPRITAWGDSIMVGADSSGLRNIAPFQRSFIDYVSASIVGTLFNAAISGIDSTMGADRFESALQGHPADLILIGFGMNDIATGTTREQFKANFQRMIGLARQYNPNAAILLVSGMRHNPDFSRPTAPFDDFRAVMYELAAQHPNVGVADVTTVYDALLSRKGYYSLTGNGANHPGDYMHRIYADVILAALRP